jgi:sorting nexin-5/6/32
MLAAETTITDESDSKAQRVDTVDLNENDILIDISDALSEKDKVKFTVHTRSKLAIFQETEFSVTRQHEEFIWLHDRYNENEEYAGLIIPPAPPRPDFDSSRAKLQKLSDSEGSLTREEYEKMKQELEAEYLAMFKKTVSMHEVFLQRLATHPVLRNDTNFRVFLEYKEDLSVRGKNAKEQIRGIFKNLTKTADEVFLANHKETDEFFERQKTFLLTYNGKIKDATAAADKSTRAQKNVADTFIKVSSGLNTLATSDKSDLSKYLLLLAEFFEKARKSESRIQSDTDLKLSDTLRYYMRDSKAALDLMYRRSRCAVDFDAANKSLDKARTKNKEVQQAETTQQNIKQKFETISEKAKEELNDFKTRRVQMFRKNLIELTELQIKHTKVQIQTIKGVLEQFETIA